MRLVLNIRMKSYLAIAAAGLLMTACSTMTPKDTQLIGVADMPLKTTELPEMTIRQAPLRAHARYVMYDAQTARDHELKKGDYYFVRWYDASPSEPVRVVMYYTQAATGSAKQMREVKITEPRPRAGEMVSRFFFEGEDRVKGGDVLTWKVELYCGGKLKDTRRSYLWRDKPGDPVVPVAPTASKP